MNNPNLLWWVLFVIALIGFIKTGAELSHSTRTVCEIQEGKAPYTLTTINCYKEEYNYFKELFKKS